MNPIPFHARRAAPPLLAMLLMACGQSAPAAAEALVEQPAPAQADAQLPAAAESATEASAANASNAATQTAAGNDPDAAAKALIARYVAGWEVDALMAEPAIAAQLRLLPAAQRRVFEASMAMTGGVEYFGGALAVAGTAQGGQGEAVLCIKPWAANPVVEVAMRQGRQITVFAAQQRYDFLSDCIRAWVPQANLGGERMRQPANVGMQPLR